MEVNIKIHCEDKEELLQHIKCIRQQIRNTKPADFDKAEIVLEDNNCYGDHEVRIMNDDRVFSYTEHSEV